MLVRSGDQPKSGDYSLDLGAWLATIILTLLRAVFEWVEKTHVLKNFLVGLIFKLLPGILQWALKYDDVYYRLLKSLWLWIGDVLATGAPQSKKEETDNG